MIGCLLLQATCQLLHSLQLYLQEAQADPAHVGSGPQWKSPPVSDPVLQTPAAVDDLLNRCLSQAEQQVHCSCPAACLKTMPVVSAERGSSTAAPRPVMCVCQITACSATCM